MVEVPLVEVSGVSKSFDATQALRDIDMAVRPGEFVGLVGPNGAGKSTLIKILDGVYAPDRGTIRVNGTPHTGGRGHIPGVGVVHQDLGVVGSLTVAENLRLGLPGLSLLGPLISWRKERDFCVGALRSVGLDESLADRMIDSLTLGERTLVAVARTFATGAEVVVIDEATSALSPAESGWLLHALRRRTALGNAVIMVSHKMSEIVDVTDRCVVLVDGEVAADVPTEETDIAALGRLMAPVVTAELASTHNGQAERPPPGEVVLRLRGACSRAAGPFDLELRAGEVVGVTGLVGSGLYELPLLAAGIFRPAHGIREVGPDVRVGLLPPDRATQANFPEQPGGWNLTVGVLDKWRNRLGLLDLHREFHDVAQTYRDMNVRPPDPHIAQGALSGGNQQKVLLGRVLLQGRGCFVLCEPTRGVDVRTRGEIYRLVRRAVDNGAGALVVSSDGEDLLALADRVGVVTDGVLDGLRPLAELSSASVAGLL